MFPTCKNKPTSKDRLVPHYNNIFSDRDGLNVDYSDNLCKSTAASNTGIRISTCTLDPTRSVFECGRRYRIRRLSFAQ